MDLPVIPLPTDEVTLSNGQTIAVRGLSRAAALHLGRFSPESADEGEAYILSQGAGVTVKQAKEWLAATNTRDAGLVIDKIVELSDLPDPQKA